VAVEKTEYKSHGFSTEINHDNIPVLGILSTSLNNEVNINYSFIVHVHCTERIGVAAVIFFLFLSNKLSIFYMELLRFGSISWHWVFFPAL
jgi:hypothetical protein